jgi:hypothetical protein
MFALPAWADDDPSAVAAARNVGVEGLRLAEQGNCKEAIPNLDRAEKLHHAPTTLAKLGECNVKEGRLVLGVEQLRRVARETLDPKAPPAFTAAKTRAQKIADETQPRIAQLHVSVIVGSGVKPTVMIDGEAVPTALLEIDRPTDPGTHSVEATAEGYSTASQSVTLKEGEAQKVTITLEAQSGGSGTPDVLPTSSAPSSHPTSDPAPQKEPESPPASSSGTVRNVGWALVGVGAAGLATGAIAGAVGLHTKSTLDGLCLDKQCPPKGADLIDQLKTEATIATIGFVVGGAFLVGGAALLFFGPKAKANVSVGYRTVVVRGAF